MHYKIKFHRKLRAKLKEVEEYDDEKGDTGKLSEDDIFEITAFPSFKNFMQNETGPKRTHPVDITQFSRNDFTSYLGDYDPNDPDEYDLHMAKAALATQHTTEKHEAEMKKIAARIAAVQGTLITNSTTETTPSKVGINCNNKLDVGNKGRITDIRGCLSHDPNINDDIAWEQIGINLVLIILENPYPMYQPHAYHPIS